MIDLHERENQIRKLAINSAGIVAPAHLTYEEFLEWADEDTYAEWVDGEVEMTSPVSNKHQDISRFLTTILDTFVEFKDLGIIRTGPFQMKLKNGREPDLIFVAKNHLGRLQNNFLDGPADLAVEIVSPESAKRDREKKFAEYEAGQVPEYWLLDPLKDMASFYQLDTKGKYQTVALDAEGKYHSKAVPSFWLRPDWFWQNQLPNVTKVLIEIGGADYTRFMVEQLEQGGFLPPK